MKKFLFIFVVTLILSCRSAQISKIKAELGDSIIFTESITENDIHGFQIDVNFPLENEKYDASILTNNFIPFKAYKGQGEIYFYAENIKSFLLYLNGKKIDTKKICKNKYTQIYIGDYVINGTNNLLITNIEAEKNFDKDYALSVKSPTLRLSKKKKN